MKKNKDGNKGTASALYVWNGFSAFWGTSFHTDPHRHDTLQLVFDIDKEFYLKDASTNWIAYKSALIRHSHLHQLDSNNSIQLFIYLDKDTDYAKKLVKKYLNNKDISNLENSDIGKISTDFFKKLIVTNNCDELFKGFLTIINHLIHFETPVKKDERIIKAISFIAKSQNKRYRVKDIAAHVCLSESRLRYLFKKQVGQPIQSFVLWMKVINSLNLVLKGTPLNQTAYDTGFWDASHMNKSYKELLGVSPGIIKKYEKDLKIISCEQNNFYTFKTEILKNWDSEDPFKIIKL